jgi:hypothetical protein
MARSSFALNLEKLRKSPQAIVILVDLAMVGLIVVNLLWLVFDTLFSSASVQSFLALLFPDFTHYYRETVHSNFVAYDMIFVSIFIAELLIRWMVAIYKKTYYKWFFYPFVHWYDVLGCIPVGSFRWLRLLRVFSILYRLQKYEIIDLSNSFPIRFVKKYFNILIEEASDRVVINVLNGVQDEVKMGNPMASRVMKEVLMPQKEVIIEWLAGRVNEITETFYPPRREQLRDYIDTIVSESISQDAKVATLEKMPVVGRPIVDVIESTVSDIVFNVLDRLVQDIGHEDTDLLVKELADMIIEQVIQPSQTLNDAGADVVVDVIEVIKDEVEVQKWKLKERPV